MTSHRTSHVPARHDDTFVLWGLFLAALAIRVAFVFASDNDDGDAYARLVLARNMTEHRSWIASEIWLPVHFWIMAVPYFLGGSSELWPRLLTAVVGAGSVPAMFLLVRRLFDRPAALLAALCFMLSPLHIRFSVVSVSEIFLVCFSVVGLWGFAAYRDDGRLHPLAIGSLAFNLACGQRMEAWVLLALLPVSTALSTWLRGVRPTALLLTRTLTYTALSSIFIVLWCSYSWWAYGDPLHIATLNSGRVRADEVYQATSPAYILAFWPAAVTSALGPVVAAVAAVGVLVSLLRGPQREAAAAFCIMAGIYYVQNARSAMITDARYSLFLATLLLPNLAPGLAFMAEQLAVLRRTVATAAIAGTAMWTLAVCGIAEAGTGLVAGKMRSITPRPLYESHVRAVDQWLRRQDDAEAIVVGPFTDALERYGPWLSILETWRPVGCIEVVRHGASAAEAVRRYGTVYQVSSAPDASAEVVFRAGEFGVHRWSNPNVTTPCDGGVRVPNHAG